MPTDSKNVYNITHEIQEDYQQSSKDDSRYTCFRYVRFRISTVAVQYHEEHQYTICGHGRS
jgi:hypothetical protein